MPMTLTEIATRLCFAVVLGAVIGIDREIKARPAGLRTHMLTSLAAAVFSVIALEMYENLRGPDDKPIGDPIRAIEAVTAGVAFLATGGIIQSRGKVWGLTTGAGMWLAGAVGVACGTGNYRVALLATLLAVVILTLVSLLERKLISASDKRAATDPDAKQAIEQPSSDQNS